jgi:hypothetical protein
LHFSVKPQDIAAIQQAYEKNHSAKLKTLRSIPTYSGCSDESIEAIAANACHRCERTNHSDQSAT